MANKFPETRKGMSSQTEKSHLVLRITIFVIHTWSNQNENKDVKDKGEILLGREKS